MSDPSRSPIDPDSPRPMGDVSQFTRRRVGPARVALAALLAVVITAIAFAILALIVWGITAAIR
jgi:hypothetical protein